RRDLPSDALRLLEPRLLRHHARDEPGRERFLRVQQAPAEDDVHRDRLSDRTRESLRAAGTRNDSERGLGLAEARRLRRDDQVTREGELAAAAEAVAGDSRDERRPEIANRVPALDASRVVELDCLATRELRDVGTGGERTLGAAEDDAADRVVAVEPLQLG